MAKQNEPRRYRFDGKAMVREWNYWLEGEEGRKMREGSASGQYLTNRLNFAFWAGMEAALKLSDADRGNK